jgi:hypothetical protein
MHVKDSTPQPKDSAMHLFAARSLLRGSDDAANCDINAAF